MLGVVCISVILFSASTKCSTIYSTEDPEEQLIRRVIKECIESPARISCFANKAAKALEKSIDWDIPVFDGIQLKRNTAKVKDLIPADEARASYLPEGFTRLISATSNFLSTHTVQLDLTEEGRSGKDGGGGGGGGGGLGGGGGGGGGKSKRLKKEKKYLQYAFMVLLGIFGLTGPLVMKTLAAMAAKALIASKVALIIVGSVALKKIFEKDHHETPSVKVHTITADDHDHERIYNSAGKYTTSPYWSYEPVYATKTPGLA